MWYADYHNQQQGKTFPTTESGGFCFRSESIVAANHYTYIYIMQKHICYFSEVFGYYNCVTVLTIILL